MLTKNAAFRALALVATSTALLGCGDGEKSVSTNSNEGIGGGAATGGKAGTGGATHAAGNSAMAGGGSSPGGSSSVGGSGGIAGASTTSNGGSTAGTSNKGGGTSAGASNIGGNSAAGNSGTAAGASAIGGGSSAGGSSSNTGGALPTGGSRATGGSAALTCSASFVLPANAALTNSDDLNANCQDGIQANVIVGTSAPTGTSATLSITTGAGTTSQVAQTTVSGGLVTFNSASLGTSGQETLTVAIGGAACQAVKTLNVNCAGNPTCTISSPTITNTHPALNGVLAPVGDRVNNGAVYQAAFQVSTDIQDGQDVILTVDGIDYRATAIAGKASFAGVYFANTAGSPDGQHTVKAQCTARSGLIGTTGNLVYPVDTTSPAVTPQKGTGTGGGTISALAKGDHWGSTDDAGIATGLQIKICGMTAAADALDIAPPNPNVNNFCVAVSGSGIAPECAPATTATGNSACAILNCPGSGPFDVDLTLKDKAGNPTTTTVTNLTCASTSPSLSFADPNFSDSTPFSDVSKRILATTNTGATRRDKNATTAGAQYDIIACTSAPAGSSAILSTGQMGDLSLTAGAITTVVADVSTGPCSPSNLIAFYNATLPESTMDGAFNLIAATELSVTVTDLNLATNTITADLWVDSNDPTLTLLSPSGFCGTYFNTTGTGSTTANVNMTFASAVPVVVTVQSQAGQQPFPGGIPATGTSGGKEVLVSGVALLPGSDTVSAVATKPSSNFAKFGSCDVTVGDTAPPKVTWQTPLSTNLLTAAGNPNPNAIADGSAAAGWQGTLTACTDIKLTENPGATLQFSVNGTKVGPLVALVATTDGLGSCATYANATIPDGKNVLLTATTSPVAGNPGIASVTIAQVDTTLPNAPSGLGAVVAKRRQTSFTLSWLAPSDPTTGSVANYKVRIAKSVISTLAAFNAATDVPFAPLVPGAPNAQESIEIFDQLIENNYYFAVAAVDSVGNQGAFVFTTAFTRAEFNQTDLKPSVANKRFGTVVDGSGDLNGDGVSDLIVNFNQGTEVDVYFGSSTGFLATPSIRIVGTVTQFGYSVAAIGDINKDGIEDMAIGSATDGNGKVYVYFGRPTSEWNSKTTLGPLDANITITGDSVVDTGFNKAALGVSVARTGDFNNDGVDDFAVGICSYNASTGLVAIVLGNALSLPTAISLPGAFGTAAIRINGDTAGSYFGYTIVGLGTFYGSASPPTIVVSAPFATTSAGRLYSILGVDASTAPISASTAANILNGKTGDYTGLAGLNALGDIGPAGQPGIGISFMSASPLRVDALSGDIGGGPFSQREIVVSSEITTNAFGRMVVGGGMSGRSAKFSFIGSNRSDVAISTRANSIPRLFIVDGDKVALSLYSGATATTIESIADVTVPLRGSFVDFSTYVTAIPDLNGDTYGDLLVSEMDYSTNALSGHVLVLW